VTASAPRWTSPDDRGSGKEATANDALRFDEVRLLVYEA